MLDTQALLWFYLGDSKLSQRALAAILASDNVKLVSPASLWEIAIKVNIGKYILNETYVDLIQHAVFDNGFAIMPIEPRHTAALVTMPYHHRDPFDRLLIAQAIVESITLISSDTMLDHYSVQRLW